MVFISYSSKDANTANAVRMTLQRNGIECWMAPDSITMGEDYSSVIPKAIESCDVFLLILSVNSQNSKWVPKELDRAILYGKPIVPFQIDREALTAAFDFMLSNIQRVEAFHDLEASYGKLIAHIKIELDHPNVKNEKNPEQFVTPGMGNQTSMIALRFSELLKEMHHGMVAYREAVRVGDALEINKHSGNLQSNARNMFLFSEYHLLLDKKIAEKAKFIVDQYNLYVNDYKEFISYPPGEARMSAAAQQYAQKAEATFNALLATILEMYQEITAE